MLLKVGELAKRVGMTVRMLHHYDAIGLLVPSARSDGGYRLYNRDDIARLHAIQALRQIGLPLNEVNKLLSGTQEPLSVIIQRQIATLKHQIEHANELCERLAVLQSRLAQGDELDMSDWLGALASMSAYGKYFSAAEIKLIFDNWKRLEPKWKPLVASIRDAMTRKISPKAMVIQPLAQRWIELNMCWVNGDFELLKRWQKMYQTESIAHGRNGIDLEMVRYIEKATEQRVEVLLKYFTFDELLRFDFELEDEWAMLAGVIDRIMQKQTPLPSKKTQAIVEKWRSLIDRTVKHDPILRKIYVHAYATEPLLRAGEVFNPAQQNFIRDVCMAGEVIAAPDVRPKKRTRIRHE